MSFKKGRLSSHDRHRIYELADQGFQVGAIASEIERREEVIQGVLRERDFPTAAFGETEANAQAHLGVLTHQLWIRPGYSIELTLPADFSAGEAERLSIMIRSLPFAG